MNYVVIKRAIVIALVVGTLLNIINQYDAIFGASSLNWLKACLTYCVPFSVSLFSSWLANRDAKAQCD
ncbi:nitrate/nitrite transporter NrtS [Vibrio europaeus]|uniref:Nitrate/nitrite transporter NrtS n=1 Tax=Vibrio europaeus TaxID=300876 RepID=A0A178JH63_9VIBR|nr:nitrate/nitrite transporter NrtS [Vibrio europaeus]MDC5706792.1 nitrate/nitrite transporter NrtS [Vibrio europaeus]MDC5712157.1 nitrate/nitrite transporter NrtS [Vibrio europaeus]MDC5716800.1 nitrate/nitrite transporter NrtS [Vibrio europaeus]MDC5721666.1 nitrate/nitrite transporter NrtS [Vibrio europaeus]MDC5726099.1 nitrate/nitrite transporter NrtS [Vibrio europaeus]